MKTIEEKLKDLGILIKNDKMNDFKCSFYRKFGTCNGELYSGNCNFDSKKISVEDVNFNELKLILQYIEEVAK